jgi:hypothetical protein
MVTNETSNSVKLATSIRLNHEEDRILHDVNRTQKKPQSSDSFDSFVYLDML